MLCLERKGESKSCLRKETTDKISIEKAVKDGIKISFLTNTVRGDTEV